MSREIPIEVKVKNYLFYHSNKVRDYEKEELTEILRRASIGRTRAEIVETFDSFIQQRDDDIEGEVIDYMMTNQIKKLEGSFGKVTLKDNYKAYIKKEQFEEASQFLKEQYPETKIDVEYKLLPSTQGEEEAIMSLPIPQRRKASIHWKHLNSVVKTLLEETDLSYQEVADKGITVYITKGITVSKSKEE